MQGLFDNYIEGLVTGGQCIGKYTPLYYVYGNKKSDQFIQCLLTSGGGDGMKKKIEANI